MKIYELAKAVDPYVVSMRRYFHENPELSNCEDKTIERICQELDSMGIRYEVVPKGGVIGYIEGTKAGKGKTVLLRADCDALPVQETKDNLAGPRVCCSKVDGVMHACGHDGHTAILLGAAKILSEHKDEIAGRSSCSSSEPRKTAADSPRCSPTWTSMTSLLIPAMAPTCLPCWNPAR